MLLASRVAPPFAARAIGSMRALAGTDPFEALAQDHRDALALFDRIEATDDSAITRRSAMLFQLKRMLTAHALAEEDIIYPMLHRTHRREQTNELYREHADMKMRLYELEQKAKDDPSWIEDVRAPHRIMQNHARNEEQIEFPQLRATFDEARRANLLGELHRKKSMLL
jgi:hemerythrin superfamily protein